MRTNMIALSVASMLVIGPKAVTLAATAPQTEGPPMYGTPNRPGVSDDRSGHQVQEERSGYRLHEQNSAERYSGGADPERRRPTRPMQGGTGPSGRSGYTPDTRDTGPANGSADYNHH